MLVVWECLGILSFPPSNQKPLSIELVPKQDPNSWLQWPLPHLETWLGGSNSLRRRWREKGGLNHFSYFGLGPGVYNWLAHIYLEVHMVLYGTWGRPVQFDTRTHFIWSGEGLLGVKDPRSAHVQLRGETRRRLARERKRRFSSSSEYGSRKK